jgi:hypothetical protein
MINMGTLIVAAALTAEAQLVTYDNFTSTLLDHSKWRGSQFDVSVGGTGVALETQRAVNEGRLLMHIRAVGGTASDSGQNYHENALQFRNPDTLTEIEFQVRVQQFQVSGCSGGAPSWAVARGFFSLFNDGAGDVIAVVEVRRASTSSAPTNELEVVGYLVHRRVSGDSLIGLVALGSASVNQTVALRTKWDSTNKLVEFQRSDAATLTVPYSLNVMSLPSVRTKFLSALALVSDCLTGQPPDVRMRAAFDNIRVNP